VPFDWENITMGWGNQYLIAGALGIALIVACARADAGVRGIASIGMLGAASAVSLASGLVAPLIGAAILLWRAARGGIAARRAVALCVVLAACALLGFALGRTSHADGVDAPFAAMRLVELALLAACWTPVWLHIARCLRTERSAFD